MILIKILLGLVIGLIFGYILSRTGITKYPRVMGMLRLKDFKILKFMMTAVISSLILFHLFGDLGWLKLSPKPLHWGMLIGGLIFGTGMGLLGYCPGTMAARIGEGKKEPIIALVGMAIGIFIYAVLIKPINEIFLSEKISGDIFQLIGVNKWIIIISAAILFSGIIYFVNKNFSDNKKIFLKE
ncbi:hypothetical protein ASZ90_005416 [hydrocarbon metagenome]|uniref:Uncharacterized protein n=1 Tax=hydrocarbon metagenome TaxID=938273 RepID=A0A0W8FVC4_9ZZZZ